MLGPGTSGPYNDSSGSAKPNSMATQTMNPFLDPGGGRNFGPTSPIAPKNGMRRQALWSGEDRNFMNGGGRNGELDVDPRLQVSEAATVLLQESPSPMPDPFRPSGGGLSRYHSAPSSFLAGLAADFQQDSALSSFFADAELPSLNATTDSSLGNMGTERSASALFDDKFLLNTRKFERIGAPQLGGAGGGGGLVSQKSLQSSFKPSMEVVLENQTVAPQQMPSSSQIQSNSQIPSSLCMPSNMGLGQQVCNSQQQAGQQQMNPLVNFTGNMTGKTNFMGNGLGSEFISNGPSGAQGRLPSSVAPNNLLRQSSSPAGLLAQLSIDVQQGQVTKIEKQSLSSPVAHSPEDSLSGGTSEENVGTTGISGMDVGIWDDVANSYVNTWGNDTFAQRKRRSGGMDLVDILGPSETSGRGPSIGHGPAPGSLQRHMSLPTPMAKIVMPDDILQSVPCRIRAKRGCATHPRSIAERVRRTRISERMRKLQDLVPNMDKQQTNTADMLDEAVEYVKQLQRQVQELTESQAKCNGSCHQDHKTVVIL